jgi:hypothetical protein
MSGGAQKSVTFLLYIALIAGFAGVWKLQESIDTQLSGLHQEQDDLVLRSGSTLKLMSLEYAPLVADLYWTRVVQYYGEKRARHDANFESLWPLMDIVTTLDPNLIIAYRFGSTFLSEPPARGAGRPDLAIELLNRGIRANPNYWRFYQDLGFIYYLDLKDYPKASAAFLKGSKVPGAEIWMKVLAAKVLEQGETRETSAFLWNEIFNTATNADIKKNALTHLQLLRADADCEQLDALGTAYQNRNGHRPATVTDLVAAGLVSGLPVDPLGFPYVFGTDGKAQLNPQSPLFKERPLYLKPL